MARAAKPTKSTAPTTASRKPKQAQPAARTLVKATRPTSAPKRAAAATGKAAPNRKPEPTAPVKPAGARKAAARTPAAASSAVAGREQLSAKVETLERLVATLRTKNGEVNRTASGLATRLASLENQVARLEQTAAPQTTPAEAAPSAVSRPAARPSRAKRRDRAVDPGDAVPPGVAVQEPAPLDQQAESALESLEEHLGPPDPAES